MEQIIFVMEICYYVNCINLRTKSLKEQFFLIMDNNPDRTIWWSNLFATLEQKKCEYKFPLV